MSAPPDRSVSALGVLRDGLRIVWRFVKAHPWSFASAVTGAAMFAGSIIASSAVIGWITDSAVIPVLTDGEEASPKVLGVLAAVLLVATWKGLSIVMRRTSAGWLQLRNQQDLRRMLVEHQLRLEMSWFERQSIGDLLAVADNDTSRGTNVLAPLPYATGVSLLVIGSMVLLTLLDPWLGLVAVVGLSLVVWVEVRSAIRLYPHWEQIQTQTGVVTGAAHESFDGALTVKALGREDYETERLRVESDDLRDKIVYVGVRWETYRTIIVTMLPAIGLVALLVGAMRVDAGAITAGDVVTALYLLSLLTFPIQLIAFVLFDLAIAIPSWDRVAAVLEADELVAYGEERADPAAGAAGVDTDRVDFRYEEDEAVLTDVRVDITAGRTVAVVGPTGSGKTTLTLLMARLWDPGSGAIAIDGRDLRAFARYELPREIAYVAQTAYLFDDTVLGNITMGIDLPPERVEEAARLAGAHEFIEGLPEGYGTRIGERGASLSGGQRQRIALARALVRRPRLLIMDDATSAVDPSVEAEILRRLRASALPSTIVIVAYRPSSIRLADEVVFIDEGRVVAQGSHSDLLAAHPGYADLVQAYEREAAARREGGA
ncbi:MAG: ABC transporter ATP-binding protein/permease [Actinobacteria bacterium]|nr:ABC transporter ATP-binding protein/permease [Actinomycetota bacterium]